MFGWCWLVEESDSVSTPESCRVPFGQHSTTNLPSQLLPAQQLRVRQKPEKTERCIQERLIIAWTISPTLVYTRFVSCIQLFLQYDSVCPQGVTQQVTHRVAPLLTGATYGDNIRLLNSVIQVCHFELDFLSMPYLQNNFNFNK